MTFPFIDMFSYIGPALGDTEVISVSSRGAGSYDSLTGKWVQAASSDTLVDAVVQPANLKDIQQLPENEQSKETLMIFTRSAMVSSDVNAATESDIVTWCGREYKVMMVDNWSKQAGYVKHICVRCGS